MTETIDLITLNAGKRELRAFSKETEQPTSIELLDLEPMSQVHKIEIGEEFITITYNEKFQQQYNTRRISHTVWELKYNDDPDLVAAIGKVIDLARGHLRDLPENVACPPGCANCCSGYEPFVSRADVVRLAHHFTMAESAFIKEYVVERPSADGFALGYLRKVTEDVADRCVFLKGKESGEHYCGVYEARPHDCRAYTPIECPDVDTTLPRDVPWPVGRPFKPRHHKNVTKRRSLG